MTAVVIVPENVALEARLLAGVNVAVVPEYDTAPISAVEPCCSVNEVALIVDASMVLLKLAVTSLLIGTPVAVSGGFFEITKGADVSETRPVVKVHVTLL